MGPVVTVVELVALEDVLEVLEVEVDLAVLEDLALEVECYQSSQYEETPSYEL